MQPEAIHAFLEAAPVSRTLGLEWLDGDGESCRLRMAAAEELGQQLGFVQGGVLGALADQAAATALWIRTRGERRFVGCDYHMEFLRPAQVGGAALVARATVEHCGRQRAVVDVVLAQGESRAARGSFRFLFPADPPERAPA